MTLQFLLSTLEGSESKPPHKKLAWPPSAEEIVRAVENAGYPLELRISRALKKRGFEPAMPFRSRFDDHTGTREIDLLASLRYDLPFEEAGQKCRASFALRLFIQAKRLHQGLIVGLRGPGRTKGELRLLRATMGGLPSWGLGSDVDVPRTVRSMSSRVLRARAGRKAAN